MLSNKETWKYNREWATTTNCDACGGEIDIRFHKNGTPFRNYKSGKKWSEYDNESYHQKYNNKQGIYYVHNDKKICYERVTGKKW